VAGHQTDCTTILKERNLETVHGMKMGIFSFRNFIRYILLVSLCVAPRAIANPNLISQSEPEYRLRLYHVHTSERLDIIYRHGDSYDSAAQSRLSQYLRDYRTRGVHDYDPRVFDLLHDLLIFLGRPDAEINVLCGYRTPRTNEYLRTHGRGVARHSLHMQAMAIDICVPGVPATRLRDAALALRRGGVGYYAASGFVHVDVGRVRHW
jgi:uncharacterized protein YcbK (DUF882 family)